MNPAIKLSSPATRDFWEIPVIGEDPSYLALDKPAGLPVTPEAWTEGRPVLLELLHAGIRDAKPWAAERNIDFLMPAHRLDAEASGVLLLARSKEALSRFANYFGADRPGKEFLALAQGEPSTDRFEVDAKLMPHPARPNLMVVNARRGKKSRTTFVVVERFKGYSLLKCDPLSGRPHQVRAHLRKAGFPVAGDTDYGGRPLLLSRLKPGYRLKPDRTEHPLILAPALHADRLALPHPVTGEPLELVAPVPKALSVALKYLRRFAV